MGDGQGFARRVTLATLELFAPLLARIRPPVVKEGTATAQETDLDTANTETPPDPVAKAAEALFAGESIEVSVPYHAGRGAPRQTARPTAPPAASARPPAAVPPAPAAPVQLVRGGLLWQKTRLPGADVQRSPAGNVTGGLRLTQAKWTVAGRLIDQTTYFRKTVFGRQNWSQIKASPYVEGTSVTFDVTVRGTHYGTHTLRVSHKPSGEAGQGNYTTILHWGDLGELIRKLNLVERTFRLYAPPIGQTEPFFIDIS
jgi:hypothetical protein